MSKKKCPTGKVQYSSLGEAHRAADVLAKRDPFGRLSAHGYRCVRCHLWHVTSRQRGNGRRR